MKRLISKLLVVLLIIISVMVPVCAEDNDYYDENSNFVVEPSLVDLWCDYYNDLYSFNYDGESVYVIGASLYDYEIEEGQYDVDYRDFDVTIGLYEEASTENEDEYFHGNPAFEYRITDYTDFCYIAVGSESLKKGKKYRFVADYGSYEDLS